MHVLLLLFLLLKASTSSEVEASLQSLGSSRKTTLKLVDSSSSARRGERARNLKGTRTHRDRKVAKENQKTQGGKSKGKKGTIYEPETDPPELPPGCDAPISLLDFTNEERTAFRACFGYDKEAHTQCDADESFEQSCSYTYNIHSRAYECNCTVKSNVELFRSIDTNGDNFGSAEEIRAFLNKEPCVFPFTYKNYFGIEKTHTSCITEDEPSGHEWCSVKTNDKGDHIPTFYKYCTEEGMEYFGAFILQRFDRNNDGGVSYEELIALEQDPSRNLASDSYCGNDCDPLPGKCIGQLGMADPECRNRYKTIPLGDEELLRILADAQLQAYDVMVEDSEITYVDNPIKRYELGGGDRTWLEQTNSREYEYIEQDYAYAACLLFFEPPTNLTDRLLRLLIQRLCDSITFGFCTVLTAAYCSYQTWWYADDFEAVSDGVDAVQWSLYEIKDGEHAGETILSYMGTDFMNNAEQAVADVWGLPYSKPMMYTMVLEATEIAEQLNPTYITGHSLGGFIAQGVCTETGIPGASFGGIGGHDPGSAETTIFRNNYHHGVRFEVVMNSYDIVARTVASMEGSECSFITSSCNVRWLYFNRMNPFQNHSPNNYAMETNQEYSRGWSEETQISNPNLVQLPGVSLNKRCDFCFRDAQCEESLYCNLVTGYCGQRNAPTYCPANSASGSSTRSQCVFQEHCSGYCDDSSCYDN
mmetsp:Transcript_5382/g.8481  ORF Transcript_5382/g.8481 Transcript_5382/m.8481 type:complete len:702 (-) Transcript_5382:184-2289(-)